MWKCDYCGTRNKDEREDCRNCGAPSDEGHVGLDLVPVAYTCAQMVYIDADGQAHYRIG